MSPSRGSLALDGVTCYCSYRTNRKKKKASGFKSMDYFHCLPSPKSRGVFSEKCHQNRFSLFSGWDKQDFIQSGMTQQHWGPQWFFPLLSKQNYYSPGNRAVQTQALHHLAPPWNIPWKWLSLSSAASSAAGHERCRTASVWVLSARGMSTVCCPVHCPWKPSFTLDMSQIQSQLDVCFWVQGGKRY